MISIRRNRQSQYEEEKKTSKKTKASKNITQMVIFTWVLQIFGTTPYLIYYCLSYVVNSSQEFKIFEIITTATILMQHGSYIFIYFFHNRLFRQVLIGYFKKLFLID